MEHVSLVSSVLGSTLKLTEKIFEIRAVDQEAKNLLETIDGANGQLEHARSLRRQRSGLLSTTEKTLIDVTFRDMERAVGHVAELVEPCRVAMAMHTGDVGIATRLLFVLRDSPRAQLSVTRLSLASQSLQTAIVLLCSRDPHSHKKATRWSADCPARDYEETHFLTESMARNLMRKAIAGSDLSSIQGARSLQQSNLEIDEFSIEKSDTESHGKYLPYRPVTANWSTDSLASTVSLPDSLRPGVKSSPPIFELSVYDQKPDIKSALVELPGDLVQGATFAFPCESETLEKPLLHKMVKLDESEESKYHVQRIPIRGIQTAQPFVYSGLPEVVPGTSPVVLTSRWQSHQRQTQ